MNPSLSQTSGLSLGALVLGGVVIALSPILVRLSELGPVATALWRVALAMLPLIAWRAVSDTATGSRQRPGSIKDVVALALPGVMLAGDLLTWHVSIHLTSVANATLLANIAPIFVVLGGWLLFRTAVTRTFLIGLAVSVAGIAILNGGAASGGQSHVGGDALALVAAAFYAGYILALWRLRSRYSTLTTLLWSSASAAVFILPFTVIFEPTIWPPTIYAWAILLALAWLCHVCGQGLIIYALALLPASFSSLTLLIQPVVAAGVAWMLLNEPISLLQAIGGVIVIAGILFARRG
ncbi:DMT family transporter [Mesorhizobium sp. BE184]|uniref:DMT family transporter n=1 Tax=Mesorhizobium sp. BE184 TaxID=2817714 RepID=UPI002864A7B8|nr:DMT family transporter [Mesorhizobium sp. BE184]MDR7032739.1 drug/metabolite transporter (DMT)-like permease [Mesorhizobium sp. BE184]